MLKYIMDKSKYTKCYLSEVGHNNFLYPSDDSVLLASNCDYDILPWIGAGATGLKAIKVPRSCLLLLKINENTKNNTAPPIKQGYTVVWIPEEFIAP